MIKNRTIRNPQISDKYLRPILSLNLSPCFKKQVSVKVREAPVKVSVKLLSPYLSLALIPASVKVREATAKLPVKVKSEKRDEG